jgi:hypothetical protein
VKLILEACKVSKLTRSSITFLHTSTVCDLQSISGKLIFCGCTECPGPVDVEHTLEDAFMDNSIENITFNIGL